ncbi:hypothetical protein [Magnetovibrio sp.]|uniref:hypothetical protein n=1 Tax=Magnetovibrio sp. TaxID=2024836 RepID=UPI002F958D9D
MNRIIVIVIAMSIASHALAQAAALEQVSSDPRHVQCFTKSKKKPDWPVCEELIEAMLARHNRGEKVSGFISCVPPGTPPEEVRKTFHAWISKRPHFAKYTPWDTLSGGLSVLYRCPP